MISIIMPTYNRGYIIERAIKSVINQTYLDWELIIVDDGSTDNTKQVVAKYEKFRIRYYVNNVNKGANASRNIGIEHAKGEIIAFLDSDNYWPEYRLERQIQLWQKYGEREAFLYGKVSIKNEDSIRIFPDSILTNNELIELEMYRNVVDMNTILISKELLKKIGGFDETLPRLQDWELVLRLLITYNVEAICCEEILSYNELQKDSIGRSESKFVKAYEIIFRKYMYSYLSKNEVISRLVWIMKEKQSVYDFVEKMIIEVGKRDNTLIVEAIRRILHEKDRVMQYENITRENIKKIQASRQMEQLLYDWQKKNSQNETGNVFSKYFYMGSNVKRIAIYGMGKVGQLFWDSIKGLPVEVLYGIDKEKVLFEDFPIKRPDEILEKVDWIIIAVSIGGEKIKADLKKMGIENTIMISELIENA